MSNSTICKSYLDAKEQTVKMSSNLKREQQIAFTNDVFSINNNVLANQIAGRHSLFVVSGTIMQLYGDKINAYIEHNKSSFKSHVMILQGGEHNKDLNTVAKICATATEYGCNRRSPIIAVGGGICTDMGGLAATLFRRGVMHIKIPTTFLGLIDAGIAIKNGVNLDCHKNILGTFSPPEASIIDLNFMQTLDDRQIVCGIAESLKMGLVCDKSIYDLWDKFGVDLRNSKLQRPLNIGDDIVRQSIMSMLKELSTNIYECNSLKRAVDFGHTFSPYIESASKYQILHGEAVAIDMAISCQISHQFGYLSKPNLDAIIHLFKRLGFPIYSQIIETESLWKSLDSICAHRNGALNLVIPGNIASCYFIEAKSLFLKNALTEALRRLSSDA